MARKRKSTQSDEIKRDILFEIYGISLLAVSLVTMASYGAIGRNLTTMARFIVGTWDFIVPLFGIWLAIYVMVNRRWPSKWTPKRSGFVMIILALLAFNHYLTFQTIQASDGIVDTTWYMLLRERASQVPMDVGGGMTGAFLYAILYFLFDNIGTLIVLGAMVLCGLLLVLDISYRNIFNRIKKFLKKQKSIIKNILKRKLVQYLNSPKVRAKRSRKVKPIESLSQEPISDPPEPVITNYDEEDDTYENKTTEYQQLDLNLDVQQNLATETFTKSSEAEEKNIQSKKQLKQDLEKMEVKFDSDAPQNYMLPPIHLLHKSKKRQHRRQEDIQQDAYILTEKMESFGVKATVTEIHCGPAVTRYEIEPHKGVKVSQILNLANDIALALAAKDIRIEAPIPGKSAVGIEVPNKEIAMIGLREVIESANYQKAPFKLCLALGRDIYGNPIIENLAQMPHLLIAGATGSGKSVCINAIITSLLYKARSDEVKMMMIDPKMVELNVYNGIPHLLVPVVTDPRKAAIALKKVVAEMERRYEQFAKVGARDIERYNQMIREEKIEDSSILPYIVVVVDELADLMMVAPSDVEDAISRLAQMARAAGIHLIIATQRPSVDVITGVIKANIPTRIAFAVSSQADSRTILGMGGAEKLLGRGDMLFLPIGASKPVRIQGAYLSDEEVERVVKFIKAQQKPEYQEDLIATVENKANYEIEDELYPQAVRIILEAQTASVSLLQRRLRIGYTRAARLIDIMEANGIVGPYEGNKPREVLITMEQFEENKRVAK